MSKPIGFAARNVAAKREHRSGSIPCWRTFPCSVRSANTPVWFAIATEDWKKSKRQTLRRSAIRKTGLQTFMTLCCFKTTQCQTQSTTLLQETPVNRFGRIFHWHGQHPVNQSINRLSFGMRGNPFWPQILRKAYFAPMIPPHTLATRESATPINTIQAAAVTALTSC